MLWLNRKENDIEYFSITRRNNKTEFAYSKKELNKELEEKALNHRVLGIYSTAYSFLDPNTLYFDHIDYVYAGGRVYILLENGLLDIGAAGPGMDFYGFYENQEFEIIKEDTFSSQQDPEDYEDLFIEISPLLSFDYLGKEIKQINIFTADSWEGDDEAFDKEKAEKAVSNNDLPDNIELVLENGLSLGVVGSFDASEFYFKTISNSHLDSYR